MSRRMLLVPVEGAAKVVEVPNLDVARKLLGAEYVERVRVDEEWAIAVDGSGRLKCLPINMRGSVLYGMRIHGTPIHGDVLLGREAFVGDGVDWVDAAPDDLATYLEGRLA